MCLVEILLDSEMRELENVLAFLVGTAAVAEELVTRLLRSVNLLHELGDDLGNKGFVARVDSIGVSVEFVVDVDHVPMAAVLPVVGILTGNRSILPLDDDDLGFDYYAQLSCSYNCWGTVPHKVKRAKFDRCSPFRIRFYKSCHRRQKTPVATFQEREPSTLRRKT